MKFSHNLKQDGNIWFTSDLHIDHKNILKYCKRPAETIEEMQEKIIANHNAVVSKKDVVFNLGDFTFNGKNAEPFISKLNGRVFNLIAGNHDDARSRAAFDTCSDMAELTVTEEDGTKQFIVLCHYALRVWNHSHHGSWNLYGHSHGSLPGIGKQMDVGIDCHPEFRPFSYNELKDIFSKIQVETVDHHD